MFLLRNIINLYKKLSMTGSKFKVGDEVSFEISGELYKGTVAIVDSFGTFENPGEPSYDILCSEALIKHVPEYLCSKISTNS